MGMNARERLVPDKKRRMARWKFIVIDAEVTEWASMWGVLKR